jgi:hypothetical protein
MRNLDPARRTTFQLHTITFDLNETPSESQLVLLEIGSPDVFGAMVGALDSGGQSGLAQWLRGQIPVALRTSPIVDDFYRNLKSAIRKRRPSKAAALEKWGLVGAALIRAQVLLERVPTAVITSGRRNRQQEGWAWAPNTAANPRWMTENLWAANNGEHRAPLRAIEAEVLDPASGLAGNAAAIATRLLAYFETKSEASLHDATAHIPGLAFDLTPSPQVTLDVLRSLPKVVQVIDETNHLHAGF